MKQLCGLYTQTFFTSRTTYVKHVNIHFDDHYNVCEGFRLYKTHRYDTKQNTT